MFKKFVAAAATLLLGAGMAVIAVAAPAAAHHTTIKATVVCDTATSATITWSVQNWNGDKVGTVIESTDNIVPAGTTFASNETKYYYQTVTTTGNKTLKVTMDWDKADPKQDQGSITIKQSDFDKCNFVTPNPPSVTYPLCTQTTGSYTIPSTTGVKYFIKISGPGGGNTNLSQKSAGVYNIPTGKTLEIWAEANNGWVLSGTTSWGPYKIEVQPGGCLAVATAPVEVVPTCEAGESIQLPLPALTNAAWGDIVYSGVNNADWTVTATATPGFSFDTNLPGVHANGTKQTFSGTLAPPLGPNYCTVLPVAPTATPITACETYGSLVFADTLHVQYALTAGDGKQGAYTVTATPAPGYFFTGPQSVEFKGDLGEYTVCATPVEPTVVPITECGVYGSVTPKVTEGVVYTLTAGDGKQGAYTITATPADGYSFVGPQSVEFKGDLGKYTDCVTPTTVDFANGYCDADNKPTLGTFDIPSKTGVVYSVSFNGGPFTDYLEGTYTAQPKDVVKVVAKALPGYTIVGTSEWNHTFDTPFCPPVLADYEVFLSSKSQVCTPGGVTPGSVTVSVVAGPVGNPVPAVFILDKGTPNEKEITGTTQLPAGNYTVTAQAKLPVDSVYSSTGESQPDGTWKWNVAIGGAKASDCAELTTLALTGSVGTGLGLSLAGGLLFLGLAAMYVRRKSTVIAD